MMTNQEIEQMRVLQVLANATAGHPRSIQYIIDKCKTINANRVKNYLAKLLVKLEKVFHRHICRHLRGMNFEGCNISR